MKFYRTTRFKKNYKKLPSEIKKAAQKQLSFLFSDPKHPSLNIKKMQDSRNIWEGRIAESYRFTFQIKDDTYILRTIGTHDVLKNP